MNLPKLQVCPGTNVGHGELAQVPRPEHLCGSVKSFESVAGTHWLPHNPRHGSAFVF